jgi:hypothetical protein
VSNGQTAWADDLEGTGVRVNSTGDSVTLPGSVRLNKVPKRGKLARRVAEIVDETGLLLRLSRGRDHDSKRGTTRDLYVLSIRDTDEVVLSVYGRQRMAVALEHFVVGYNLSQKSLRARIQGVMKEIQS